MVRQYEKSPKTPQHILFGDEDTMSKNNGFFTLGLFVAQGVVKYAVLTHAGVGEKYICENLVK